MNKQVRFVVMYDASQPREPAGTPEGGRWASQIGNLTDGSFGGHVGDEKYYSYLESRGVSKETGQRVGALFDEHVHGGEQQEKADEKILQHWEQQDEIGKALRVIADVEEAAAKAVQKYELEDVEKRFVETKSRWERELLRHPESPDKLLYWEYLQAQADREERREKGLYLWRRRREGGEPRIQAWTRHEEGADTHPLTGGARIVPDRSILLRDVEKKGYRILFGYARQRGYGGEAEILLLRL